jgi:hypothetical protein
VSPVTGAFVGPDEFGSLTVEVELIGVDGRSVEASAVPATLVTLSGAVSATSSSVARVGSSNTFRFGFGTLTGTPGALTVTVGTAWSDSGGNAGAGATATITVAQPAAELSSPHNGEVIGAGVINGRGYVDVLFRPVPGHAVDAGTVTDSGAELTITGPAAITIGGAAVRQGDSNVFRYTFTGTFVAGVYSVAITAGAWLDTGGNSGAGAAGSFRIDIESPTADLASPGNGSTVSTSTLNGAGAIEITFYPVRGNRVDEATLVGAVTLMQAVVIRREEDYLERRFGSDYLDYKAAVRRWI